MAMLLYLPVFVYKLIRRGNFLHHFGERFGWFTYAQQAALKRLRNPVWIHAVSVGEVMAALSFIRRWQEQNTDLEFVLSTTTTTGHATAESRLPERVKLIYCPLDFPFAVRLALRLIRPRMLVIFEVEIWPNLVTMAVKGGTRVVLVNGRMSDRSTRGYRRFRCFFRGIFNKISLFCVQSPDDAERFRFVCNQDIPVQICNTMKFDQIPDPPASDIAHLMGDVFGGEVYQIWTAGSTHPGEELLIIDVFCNLKRSFPNLKLVLVPRHHERTREVEEILRQRRLNYRLRKSTSNVVSSCPVDVLLVNTTGELMKFYAIADVAFVGKSLAGNKGGHNIIEPAIWGKAIVHGAQLDNFRLVTDIFRKQHGTAEVSHDGNLEPVMRHLLNHPEEREELGRRARCVVEQNRGAIDQTIRALELLLS